MLTLELQKKVKSLQADLREQASSPMLSISVATPHLMSKSMILEGPAEQLELATEPQ